MTAPERLDSSPLEYKTSIHTTTDKLIIDAQRSRTLKKEPRKAPLGSIVNQEKLAIKKEHQQKKESRKLEEEAIDINPEWITEQAEDMQKSEQFIPKNEEYMYTDGVISVNGIYLADIARIPLLTREEEISLAQARDRGRAALSRLQSLQEAGGVLEEEITHKLEEEISLGKQASNRMIEANLRLVISVAQRYKNRGLPLVDLIQEGNIGLARGVEKFEWERGWKFSTYAYWWIRQAVSRSLAEQSRTIRLPVHMIEQLSKLFALSNELESKTGKRPTSQELAALTGLSPRRIEDAFKAAEVTLSLESPVHTDESTSDLGSLIPDESQASVEEQVEDHRFIIDFHEKLAELLTRRQREVLIYRFGLDGSPERTLQEVGNLLGLSRERVRQLQVEAFKKLRSTKGREKLVKMSAILP